MGRCWRDLESEGEKLSKGEGGEENQKWKDLAGETVEGWDYGDTVP